MTIQQLVSVLSNCKTFNKCLVLTNDSNSFSINRFVLLSNGKLQFQIQYASNQLESGIEEKKMSCLIEDYQIKEICSFKDLPNHLEAVPF